MQILAKSHLLPVARPEAKRSLLSFKSFQLHQEAPDYPKVSLHERREGRAPDQSVPTTADVSKL